MHFFLGGESLVYADYKASMFRENHSEVLGERTPHWLPTSLTYLVLLQASAATCFLMLPPLLGLRIVLHYSEPEAAADAEALPGKKGVPALLV